MKCQRRAALVVTATIAASAAGVAPAVATIQPQVTATRYCTFRADIGVNPGTVVASFNCNSNYVSAGINARAILDGSPGPQVVASTPNNYGTNRSTLSTQKVGFNTAYGASYHAESSADVDVGAGWTLSYAGAPNNYVNCQQDSLNGHIWHCSVTGPSFTAA